MCIGDIIFILNNLSYREKRQKIEDIKKNIRDAILVSFSKFYGCIVE
jgi:hypothetical protein